jgi:hypothetical protein
VVFYFTNLFGAFGIEVVKRRTFCQKVKSFGLKKSGGR